MRLLLSILKISSGLVRIVSALFENEFLSNDKSADGQDSQGKGAALEESQG